MANVKQNSKKEKTNKKVVENKKKVSTTKTDENIKPIINNKKSSKKKKNNLKKLLNKLKEVVTSTKFLKIVFLLLCILIIILIVLIVQAKAEVKKNPPGDITIPVKKDSRDFDFNISAYALAKEDEYLIKITNTRNKISNTEKVNYKIAIRNENDCVISVTKNKSKKNLITDQKLTIIDGQSLDANILDNDYYHVKIVSKGKLDEKDLINVRIYK